jgi:iron-sulfur cluster repair protein YtfE (RIC family)
LHDFDMGFGHLVREHQQARVLLASLVAHGPDETTIESLADLLTRHMADEEENLIPFVRGHLPTDTGPVSVILAEHDTHREILATLRRAPDRALIHRLAGLISSHFAKEEEVILPFAERLAPGDA